MKENRNGWDERMNIVYLSVLDGRPWAGPTYSVPKQIEAQSKVDHVLWYNQCDRNTSPWKDTMAEWSRKEYYADLSDYPQASLQALPEPFSKPDLVIMEQCYKFKKSRILWEMIRGDIPYVVIPRVELTAKAQMQKKLKKKIGNALVFSRFLKKAAAIQYLTEQEAKDSGDGWNKRFFVLPNGSEPSDEVQKRTEPHEGIRCIFIGRLAPFHKGLDLLIEACGNLRNEMAEAGCVIDAYGPDREEKMAEMQEATRVKGIDTLLRFHEGIYGEEKTRQMLQSDVFLMTSRFEGHPTALLDAMAMGLPVMVTRGTNMLEEVREANAGWTAEGSAESIQDMILKMIREKDRIGEKGRNARKLSEKYDWDAIAERGHELYLQLLK